MKKIFGILMVTALALTSCADDDYPYHPGDETGETLLRKMVVNYPGQSVTSLYNYDGDRITSISHSTGITENYTYINGTALSEVRYYDNGALTRKSTFEYSSSGAFTAVVNMYYDAQNPSSNFAERFTYAAAGNEITVVRYLGDEQSQTVEDKTYLLKVVDNNITAITGDTTANYSFDYQPSPLSNVGSFAVISLANLKGGVNNILSQNTGGSVTGYSYTYNPEGFPSEATVTSDNVSYTITYTY